MGFPDILSFPLSHPGPYERNMGAMIVELLRLFHGRVPDAESAAHVSELVMAPARWSAAHEVFNELRRRCLIAIEAMDQVRAAQYAFEELCCTAMYNATSADDPFDPSSPFFVAGAALRLARAVDLPVEQIVAVLASTA
ncbi:MAG: hypothetical protein JWL69_4186 [Phycisphaerales bacterium]|nr:hypothetical protein [Phycisphaerales bacterium]MDB5357856.1 hypothetical protein [Phycisphaerales bacterium]